MKNRNKVHSFTVRTHRSGGFPLSMLRYDEAYPSSDADAGLIETLIRGDDDEISRLPTWVDITLSTSKWTSPTIARWDSFVIRVLELA